MSIKIVILLLFFIGTIFIALIISSSRTKLIKAHAGGMNNVLGGESNISFFKYLEKIVTTGGLVLSWKKYFPIEVEGNCLSDIGIEDGDILIVERLNDKKSKGEIIYEIKPFDVILLKVDKDGKDIYKIRIVEKVLNNKEIETFYFEKRNDGTCKRRSLNSHNFKQVQGIISYKKKRAA